LSPLSLDAYLEDQQKQRVVLNFLHSFSLQSRCFPASWQQRNISNKAREIFDSLKSQFPTLLDERGNIGKRYYTHDEIGTPFCITIDYQTSKTTPYNKKSRHRHPRTNQPYRRPNILEEKLLNKVACVVNCINAKTRNLQPPTLVHN